jgi:hypothetical protein
MFDGSGSENPDSGTPASDGYSRQYQGTYRMPRSPSSTEPTTRGGATMLLKTLRSATVPGGLDAGQRVGERPVDDHLHLHLRLGGAVAPARARPSRQAGTAGRQSVRGSARAPAAKKTTARAASTARLR